MYKVIDTNIILLDAHNLTSLASDGSTIVLPETVLDEIDSFKSGHSELAFQAREFGRLLTLAKDVSVERTDNLIINSVNLNGVTIELVSLTSYPDYEGMKDNVINDRKIIEVALAYQQTNRVPLTFITNDIACKHRAKSFGLEVQELKEVDHIDFEFVKNLDVPYDLFLNIHDKSIELVNPDHVHENFNYKFTSSASTTQTKLAYISPSGLVKVIGKDTEKELRDAKRQPAPPINAEQLMLSRAILDPAIDLIVCEALAGSGKTITALSNAMRLVATHSPYDSITYIRASVSDLDDAEEVGFLPGLEEKFAPYLHPVKDSLDFIARKQRPRSKSQPIEDYEDQIETLISDMQTKYNITAMTGLGLRGRTFTDSVVIIDEVQNMSKASLQKVLTRFGKNCKVILIGSNRQIDNAYINKFSNGLSVVLDSCTKPSDLVNKYAITLTRVVRSPFAEWAEGIFSS